MGPFMFKDPTGEDAPKPSKELFIGTDRGGMRAEVLKRDGNEVRVKVIWTHDGNGVGAIDKIQIDSLKGGQPMRFSASADGGVTFGPPQESGALKRFGAWERSTYLPFDVLVGKTERRDLSANLPDNPALNLAATDQQQLLVANKPYRDALPEYSYGSEAEAYASANAAEAKFNLPFGTGNIGWKAHLNVAPSDVARVADYLKQNGYYHKYLTGGIGSEGKAFTVYFGAKSVMDRWAPKLAADLGSALAKPAVIDEAEMAPGVVARFTSLGSATNPDLTNGAFTQYGEYGMAARKTFIDKNGGWKYFDNRDAKREMAYDSYSELSKAYGSYFHG